MVWLSRLLLIVLVFALVTGRAYFVRGFVSKKTNPRLYWQLVAFYLLMTSMLFIKLMIPYVEYHFSNAATRAALEIEKGALRLKQARLNTTTLSLMMESDPKGCDQDYIFQIGPGSALSIWCKAAGQVTSSYTQSYTQNYTTTEHLNLVLVPQVLKIEKKKGEPLLIELQLQNGQPSDAVVVTGLH